MQNNKPTTAAIAFADTIIAGLQLTLPERQEMLQQDAANYVQALFGWSEQRFKAFGAGLAHNYCFHYTNGNTQLMHDMMDTDAFWAWFINGFHNRNVQFMEAHQSGAVNPYTPYNEYLTHYQNAKVLAQQIYPGPEVWAQVNRRAKP